MYHSPRDAPNGVYKGQDSTSVEIYHTNTCLNTPRKSKPYYVIKIVEIQRMADIIHLEECLSNPVGVLGGERGSEQTLVQKIEHDVQHKVDLFSAFIIRKDFKDELYSTTDGVCRIASHYADSHYSSGTKLNRKNILRHLVASPQRHVQHTVLKLRNCSLFMERIFEILRL